MSGKQNSLIYGCSCMYLVMFECAVYHQGWLLLHTLNYGMSHPIIRLGAGLSSGNAVLIINILLGWPEQQSIEEIFKICQIEQWLQIYSHWVEKRFSLLVLRCDTYSMMCFASTVFSSVSALSASSSSWKGKITAQLRECTFTQLKYKKPK